MRILYLCLSLWATVCTLAESQNLNVTHRSTLTFQGQNLANVWGYASGGYEYALVGGQFGLIIVDVTSPDNPVVVKQIPGPSSIWREVRTYGDYAYVVTEGGNVGVQIINLSNLPDTNLVWKNVVINGLTKAHALDVDEARGFLYLYGSNQNSGRPVIWNLANPYNPTYAGMYQSIGYVHDGYANNDTMYSAHIYQGQVAIVYMGNKNNPVTLGTFNTPGNFTHNTWRSGNILMTTDEISNSFLAAYDISDPSDPVLLDKIQSNPGSGSVVHNTHIINEYAVTSWYKDGFTITDISRPDNLVQVGNYDTYPQQGGAGFDGCWGVYPYLPSGNILASNMKAFGTQNGELWVLTPNYMRACHLEGVVYNQQSGQPIPGVQVTLVGGPSRASQPNGVYKMGQVQSGVFTVQAFQLGYHPFSTTVTLDNGVLTTLNIPLKPFGLPVEFTAFDAVLAGADAAHLSWETVWERDNAGFEIEYSADAFTWNTIGFVHAQGLGSRYSFIHESLGPGRHYYRLRQRDLNGESTLTPIRLVRIFPALFTATLSPNPVRDQAILDINDPALPDRTYEIGLYSAHGQLLSVHRQRGNGSLALPAERLDPGVYLVIIQSQGMDPYWLKFLK